MLEFEFEVEGLLLRFRVRNGFQLQFRCINVSKPSGAGLPFAHKY